MFYYSLSFHGFPRIQAIQIDSSNDKYFPQESAIYAFISAFCGLLFYRKASPHVRYLLYNIYFCPKTRLDFFC